MGQPTSQPRLAGAAIFPARGAHPLVSTASLSASSPPSTSTQWPAAHGSMHGRGHGELAPPRPGCTPGMLHGRSLVDAQLTVCCVGAASFQSVVGTTPAHP